MTIEQLLGAYGPWAAGCVGMIAAYLRERAARDADRTHFETRLNELQEKRIAEALDGQAKLAETLNILKQAIAYVQGAVR